MRFLYICFFNKTRLYTCKIISQSRDIIVDTMNVTLSACTLFSSKREHTENLFCKVRYAFLIHYFSFRTRAILTHYKFTIISSIECSTKSKSFPVSTRKRHSACVSIFTPVRININNILYRFPKIIYNS